jgi:hypothetical protein
MTHKKLLRPDRLRQIPPQFSWLDHQLVRQQRLRGCEPSAWALYLFLVTVADARGLSYYSDPSLQRHLRLDGVNLARARQQLIEADLIAHQKPLYQVLSLHEPPTASASPAVPTGRTRSVGDILRQVLGGVP